MGDAVRFLILSLLFAVGLIMSGAGSAADPYRLVPSLPQYQLGQQSQVHILTAKSSCSATVFEKPNVILTATHCLSEPLEMVDGREVQVVARFDDGLDSTMLLLSQPIAGKRPAKLGKMPPAGAPLYAWGNPYGLRQQLRLCNVSGELGLGWAGVYKLPFYSATIDCNQWYGDSGSAMFDMQGRVVGVASAVVGQSGKYGAFKMTIVPPLHFTPQQYAKALR